MKKIFALVFLLVLGKISYSQYPLTQNLGSDSTIVISKGATQSRFVNVTYSDTASANLQRIRQYPGSQIATTSGGLRFWIRNATATGWIEISTTASTVGVTSVATNNATGITGGTITSTGTLAIDTLLISTRLWRQKGIDSVASLITGSVSGTTNYVSKFTATNSLGNSQIFDNGTNVGFATATPDSLLTVELGTHLKRGVRMSGLPQAPGTKSLRIDANGTLSIVDTTSGGGSGTVTSVATNDGTGITGGTITTAGTLAIDTLIISTRAWRQKGIDSVQANLTAGLALKLNISDTSSMLNPYLRKVDTASLSNRINQKLNISDTSSMLSPYLRKVDTTSMLANYVNNVGYGLSKVGQVASADSATLANYFLRRKDSLTATNLLGYVTRKILADTAAAIRSGTSGGSVTSVATNNGTGITGGTITTSGTLAIDTLIISTRAWRQKGIDSVAGLIGSGYVPYTGATQNVDLGQFGLKTKYVEFDTSSQAVTDRRLQWSNDEGTLQFGMTNGATITQRIGLEQFARVKNVQGTQINKGQVVYIYGASGDRASVKLADNRADSTSSKTLGVAAEDIAINDVGLVGTFGTVNNLDLSAYTPGDILYLDSIPGGLTKNKPQAPYHLVFIGVVERANSGNGQLFTNVQNGYELEELHNVRITSPVPNKAILLYDSVRRLWVDTTVAASGIAVTQVSTNAATGITGGPITTVGTISADTTLLSTRLWRQKGVDSLQANINLKLNISDTASMLSPYLRKIDTASLSNRINTKLNISDTSSMLTNYINNVGYGLLRTGQVARADSATLANYFLRRKDSLTSTNLLGYVTRKVLADTAAAIRSADAGGTVTSVATNTGTGITGGTITTAGTLAIDTVVISTRAWRQKGIDSVATLANTKVGGSGTANYISKFTGTNTIANSVIFESGTSIGINTATPSRTLDVQANSSAIHNTSLVGTNTSYVRTINTGGSLTIGIDNSAGSSLFGLNPYTAGLVYSGAYPLIIGTNGGAAISIPSTNRVGIGTASPDSLLTVEQGTLLKRGVRMSGLPTAPGTKAVRIDANGKLSIADTTTAGVGTVTSVATNNGTGITGGTITTSGTLAIDTLLISTRAWRQKGIDSVAALPRVTSVGSGYGLSGGTITTSGTLLVDSATLSNYYLRRKDSLTATNLLGYVTRKILADTASAIRSAGGTGTVTSVATNTGTGITGGTITTSGTLAIDTLLISTRAWRQKGIDSVQANLTAGLALKVNISDTASMLTPYLRKIDTTAMLSPYLRSNVASATYVPQTRTITINGTSQDLSANRTYNVGTVTSVATSSATGITGGTFTTSGTIAADTLLLSTRAWRQKGIDSVAALANTKISGSGTTNYIPKFTGASAIGNSVMQEATSNIGIGGSPSTKLDVFGTTTIRDASATTTRLEISPDSDVPRIDFVENDSYRFSLAYRGDAAPASQNIAEIKVLANAPLAFSTNSSERMRISSTGNVGIGTSSPTPFLNANARTLAIDNSSNPAELALTGQNSNLYLGNGGLASYIYSTGAYPLIFGTNGAEKMRLNSSGNLGLGVTPSAWVAGTKAFQIDRIAFWNYSDGLYLSNNTLFTTGFATNYINNGFATIYEQVSGSHIWRTAPSGTAGNTISFTQAMTLDASGNLMVGGTSAGGRMDVRASGVSTYLHYFRNSSGGYIGGIYNTGGGGSQLYLANSSATDVVLLNTNGNSYLNGGNVGIGTTSPSGRLHIDPADNEIGLNVSTSSLTGSNAQSLIDLAQTWNTTGNPTAIKLNITNTASGASADLMELQVGGTNQFRVTKGGAIETDNPTGGTKKPWKLGSVMASSMAYDDTRYVEVEIDGTLYYLALSTLAEPAPSPEDRQTSGPNYSVQKDRPIIKPETDKIKSLEKEIADLKQLIKSIQK